MRTRPRVIDRNTVYDAGWLAVEEDTLAWPDDSRERHITVRIQDAAGILPIDEHGNVHLIAQYRHGLGRVSLEIPGGSIEPGETPLEAAIRELGEERGLRARRINEISVMNAPPAYGRHKSYIFLARDLSYHEDLLDHSERIRPVTLPFERAVKMAATGKIPSMKSSLAILMAQEYLASGR